MREVFPRLGHVREFVNDDPKIEFSQDYTQAISENLSCFLSVPWAYTLACDAQASSTQKHTRMRCIGTVYEAAHRPCTHNIAGFCEAHSLRAPWAGFKSAGCVVAPRACGRIFYAFWAEKLKSKLKRHNISWLFGAQWQSWDQVEK